ncbi:hypothetical protein C7999DRAFT_32894 [Corynascus novoguineensis]|uniref:Uncharacterized protein n=1 Tax=Corynascus novoguineensis TaxID=1126955 RepID=A0AAN7CRW7_9PEZI|nr:hypothetical protein C7999DRAFT_32894 [Corynascus novoguineensis]
MGNAAEAHDISMPGIPTYVYVVSGLLVGVLLGTQLLSVWLTGLQKPTVVRAAWDPATGRLRK